MNDWTVMTWLFGWVCGTIFTSFVWYFVVKKELNDVEQEKSK